MHSIGLIPPVGAPIELNPPTAAYHVLDYDLRSAEVDVEEVEAAFLDGGEVAVNRFANVEEELTLVVTGETESELRANVRALYTHAARINAFQRTRAGRIPYITLRIGNDTYTWRSELLNLDFDPEPGALHYGWANRKVELNARIRRRFFWETTQLFELRGATQLDPQAAIGGRRVGNNGTNNYFHIESAAVWGALSTPAVLALKINNPSKNYRNFYIANNVIEEGSVYNFNPHLEESTIVGFETSDQVITGSLTSANQAVRRRIFNGTGFFRWWIDPNTIAPTANREWRVFARLPAYPVGAPINVTPKLQYYYDQSDLWTGKETSLPVPRQDLVDLGVVKLAPARSVGNLGITVFALQFQSSGTFTLDLDCVDLFDANNMRHLVALSPVTSNPDTIYDDPTESAVHLLARNTQNDPVQYKHFVYLPYQGPVRLYPGAMNRLVVMVDEGAVCDARDTFTMRVYFRPRVLTI